MIRFFFLCLLLLYYWYFYLSGSKHIQQPIIGDPSKSKPYNFKFNSKQSNHFQFIVDGKMVWEHTLPIDTFKFHQNKIVAIDPCHGYRDGKLIPAKGHILYEYLKQSPELNAVLKFKENNQFTLQQGDVFYFKCLKGHIEKLEMCPSGTTLINGACQSINICTGRPDGTLLPHPLMKQYFECYKEKELVKNCPDEHVFYINRCENEYNINHICKMFPNESFGWDETTRVKCENGKMFFKTCKPGMRFFGDNTYCEPANCYGFPDGTKIPLPEQKIDSFNFVPGYMTCQSDKIQEIVECPQKWDEMLTKGDNLTFLPMVYDGKKCSVPTFCENVFSDDPDTIVPVHEFTKHVKNWELSQLYDSIVGYVCENKTRKRKHLPFGSRISKRFKMESACGSSMPNYLPINGTPENYYDCTSKTIKVCPLSSIFNGYQCISKIENAFTYNNLPMFIFNSLNFENWINTWDYSKDPIPSCKDLGYKHIELYNICSDIDCSHYAFVSQIPDMAILLPREQKAKCVYYENEKTLKKEPVDFDYHFWTQRIIKGYEKETCTPGQKLQTGNFTWDSTIFATCNMNQPFIFCPSSHSQHIIPVGLDLFACEPPDSKSYVYDNKDWFLFNTNEIKRILPIDKSQNPVFIQRNKSRKREQLPDEGIQISEGERINLFSEHPVKIEPRFRVTHPPNVAFEYDDQGNVKILTSLISETNHYGFLVKRKNFTHKPLTFPKYTPLYMSEKLE